MDRSVNLPKHIRDAFGAHGVDACGLIRATQGMAFGTEAPAADTTGDDSWVAFDETNLYILAGSERVIRIKGSKRLGVKFDATDFESIPVADAGKLSVERMISDHASGREPHGFRLWALLCLELWFRTFIDRQ